MKNHKAMTGVAYMFLGAVLLVSGPAVQEQLDAMASNPTLQLAKAMYQTMSQETVAKPQVEVLAANTPAAGRQFDSVPVVAAAPEVRVVPAAPKVIAVATETIEVVAPKMEVELAQLPAEHQARIAKMMSKLKPAKFTIALDRSQLSRMASFKAMEMQNVVMVREDVQEKKAECDKVKQETERSTEI